MRLDFTQKQLSTMYEYFDAFVRDDRPQNVAEALVKSLVMRVYHKMHKKVHARLQGRGYGIYLTDEEAMAYYVYFQNRFLGEHCEYEQVLIQAHIDQIDQAFA